MMDQAIAFFQVILIDLASPADNAIVTGVAALPLYRLYGPGDRCSMSQTGDRETMS
jgi:hypothetical protein